MINEISCCGYRGFATEQKLTLAIPKENRRGSGLTVLVGPNSGGKSTLVECFQKIALNNASFTEGKRNKLAGDKVCIKVKYDGREDSLSTNGGSETTWTGTEYKRPKIYYLPSRRVFNPYFGKSTWNRETYIQNPENIQFRGSLLGLFTSRLFDVNRSDSTDFDKIFWRILGKKLEWTIDQDDAGQYYIRVKKERNIYHNSEGLGEGIVSLLFLSDAILNAKEDELIVIDEPELSLHPQLQLRLLNELLELTKTVQVVIATHSPNMISLESAINGGVIARVHEKDNGSVISQINDECSEYFKSCTNNIYNPHIMGSDARSCFFAEDGMIITEGQEDVILYPKVLQQLGVDNSKIHFFGFGAGGASNIKNITYILKCLGFSNIGAIFDGDKDKECKEFNQAYNEDGYKAWIIPADDIRDKDACDKGEKKGLLSKDNELKDEYKDKLLSLFSEIIRFTSPQIQ